MDLQGDALLSAAGNESPVWKDLGEAFAPTGQALEIARFEHRNGQPMD
jgi:hypothetical protein